MDEYLSATRALLERHGNQEGGGYRVVLAVYPKRGMSDAV